MGPPSGINLMTHITMGGCSKLELDLTHWTTLTISKVWSHVHHLTVTGNMVHTNYHGLPPQLNKINGSMIY